MKKLNTNKLILSIILLTSIATSFATSCEDDKQYLINAAYQIKANYPHADSLDL